MGPERALLFAASTRRFSRKRHLYAGQWRNASKGGKGDLATARKVGLALDKIRKERYNVEEEKRPLSQKDVLLNREELV